MKLIRKSLCMLLLVLTPMFLTGCDPAMIAPVLMQVSQILGAVAGVLQTFQAPAVPQNQQPPNPVQNAANTLNQVTDTAGNIGDTVNNLSGGALTPVTAPLTAIRDVGNVIQQGGQAVQSAQDGNILDAVNQGADTLNAIPAPVPATPIDSPAIE